jgi:16S rRNA (guanine1516-N2)-methyltransferase
LDSLIQWEITDSQYSEIANEWKIFLTDHFKADQKIQILFDSKTPTIIDSENRKLKIDFQNDSENYKKFKSTINSEPLSRALGAGKKGLRVLDLSAGMGVDTVFLSQLGYQVVATERNPLLYLALNQALKNGPSELQKKIRFIFSEAVHFLKTTSDEFDVCYFDPMFPQKKKSALPKQEMVLFKNLVGDDADSVTVLKAAIESKKFKRCVVKRPLSAQALLPTSGAIEGKIIRYDIYGGID